MARDFHLLCIVTALMAGLLSCQGADQVSYPEKNPLFTVDVPEGWEVKHENGAVRIVAQADAIFVLQHVSNVKDEATASSALAELAALQGKQFSLDDVKVVRPTSLTFAGDFKGYTTECIGKGANGSFTDWQLMLFSPGNDDYYLVSSFWADADAAKTAADRLAIFRSLKAVR